MTLMFEARYRGVEVQSLPGDRSEVVAPSAYLWLGVQVPVGSQHRVQAYGDDHHDLGPWYPYVTTGKMSVYDYATVKYPDHEKETASENETLGFDDEEWEEVHNDCMLAEVGAAGCSAFHKSSLS
jgi:hypothetical protein